MIYIFFLFFILPIIFDLTLGKPIYNNYPGFYSASRDKLTIITYNLLVIIPPLIWMIFKNKEYISVKHLSFNIYKIKSPLLLYILFVIIILPIFLVLLSPTPELYLLYGPRGELMSVDAKNYHFYLRNAIMISLFTIFYFLYTSKQLYISLFCLSPFILIDVWLHGKRSIVFTILIILLILVIIKKQVKGIKLVLLFSITASILLSFSLFYQFELRDIDNRPTEKQYENFRIDFGRDDETKLAIYREQKNQIPVLDYRGKFFVLSYLLCTKRMVVRKTISLCTIFNI